MKFFLQGMTALFLAITCIGTGFLSCALIPQTTEMLASSYSLSNRSPFTHDELVQAASATRDYTVWSHDYDALIAALADINRSAAERGIDAGAPDMRGAPDIPAQGATTAELAAKLSLASEEYTLTPDAISHLDDVYRVVSFAYPLLGIVAVLAAITCIVTARRFGLGALGRALIAGGLSVIILFCLIALWVFVDFNGFFAVFHSLFFAAGTWTFSIDSLLICMYPTEFWIGMGAVWLCTTILSCLIALVAGFIMIRTAHRRSKTKYQTKEITV